MSKIEDQVTQTANFVVEQVGDAAEFVASKIDLAVEGVSDALSGASGRKVVSGAVVGTLAAVVLPMSLAGGALLGAGYAAFRQIGRNQDRAPHSPVRAPGDVEA